MKAGVLTITFKGTSSKYVGVTQAFEQYEALTREDLEQGTRLNSLVQACFDEVGQKGTIFTLVSGTDCFGDGRIAFPLPADWNELDRSQRNDVLALLKLEAIEFFEPDLNFPPRQPMSESTKDRIRARLADRRAERARILDQPATTPSLSIDQQFDAQVLSVLREVDRGLFRREILDRLPPNSELRLGRSLFRLLESRQAYFVKEERVVGRQGGPRREIWSAS